MMCHMARQMTLRHLDDETWGEQVRRARERAGLSLRQATELVSRVLPTSLKSLARLEEQIHAPEDGRRQLTAYVALLAYGFEPDGFGLGSSQAAKLVNRTEVLRTIAEARSLAERVHLLLGALLARLFPIPQSGIAQTR